MELAKLLHLYDQDQRIEIEWPGQQREMAGPVIRHVDANRKWGFIAFSRLDADSADIVIQTERDAFFQRGYSLEWKLYTHDMPSDLGDRLAAHGFVLEEPEAIMVLDTEALPPTLQGPVSPAIRRLDDPDQVMAMLSVQQAVWEKEFDWLAEELADTLRTRPAELSVYAAYVEEVPVSSAWIRYTPHSRFASLWGGSTLSAFRGQGHYTALLAARVQEAAQRGLRFLTVDASPMSRPILEKHGFRVITWARECNWTNPTPTGA
ncbi:MAG: GNAT family N-acetyltransferase [Anaerolineae bacterium]|nr:GNAT family N-acetyltransferase [Anaerolineae bacterium]